MDNLEQATAAIRAQNPNALVDCSGDREVTESDAGASIWSGVGHSAGVSVCTSGTSEMILLGICDQHNGAHVVTIRPEDAILIGRKMIDLANR